MTAQDLEELWADHLAVEFVTKYVEARLAAMVQGASVRHVPVATDGRGQEQLRTRYRDDLIPAWLDDLQMKLVNRVVGDGQLVEELHLHFTHCKPMNWFLPNVPATNTLVDIDL